MNSVYPPIPDSPLYSDSLSTSAHTYATQQVSSQQSIPLLVNIFFYLALASYALGIAALLFIALLGSGGLLTFAAFTLIFIVGLFSLLLVQIRKGKRWALILYTVLLIISIIRLYLNQDTRQIIPTVVTTAFIVTIWIRHRAYFK